MVKKIIFVAALTPLLLTSILTIAFGFQSVEPDHEILTGDGARFKEYMEQEAMAVLSSSDRGWPMFHHDSSHSGYSTSTAPDTNNTIWNYTEYVGFSSPVVAYGKVYVDGIDEVYCLNASSGICIWNYTTGVAVSSSPAVADSMVFVGSIDGKVYCLNASTGAYLWDHQLGDARVSSSPAIALGKVFVGSWDRNVYCLNASTGALVWNYTTGRGVDSSPAIALGKVFVGSDDNNIYCLNATTGEYIWSYTTGFYVKSSPAVVDGRVYVGSLDNKVYCLNASDGAHIWDYHTGGDVYSSPAIAYNKVYVGSYELYWGSDDAKVWCFDAATGEYIWSYTTGDPVRSSPAVADGKVYVGAGDGKVHCIDASTGAHIWDYAADGSVDSSPAIAYGRVFICMHAHGSPSGVYCFGPIPVQNINSELGYSTIQEAIDAPETLDGHTILVAAGVYHENVIVEKSLSLVGTDKFRTIVDGNFTGNVVNITANNVNITGFTIQNSEPNDPSSGIYITSSGNNISYNILTNNYYGIYLNSSSSKIYHNNFLDNTYQVRIHSYDHTNFWDNGYPSGGNYWSGYTGVDEYRGPNQDIEGHDGIGDSPYVIDANNTDNYPLTGPVMKPVYNKNTGLRYVSIQQAINANETFDGHRIQTGACTYFEHVIIHKSVSLSGPFTPSEPLGIIDGGGSGTVVHVTADHVSIHDITIKNSGSNPGDSGIHVESSSNCNISNNKMQNNWIGVFLNNSSSCTLYSNKARNNTKYGLYLDFGENCKIYGTEAEHNFCGIQLSYSRNCSVCENKVSDNEYGIWLDNSQGCEVSGNEALHNKYGICVSYSEDINIAYQNVAEANTYGIWLSYSKNCSVGGSRWRVEPAYDNVTYVYMPENYVYNNEYGIRLDYCEDCHIRGSVYTANVKNNEYGIWVGDSWNCQIQGFSELNNNTLVGIVLDSSRGCVVRDFQINEFGGLTRVAGIFLRDSEDCVVSENQVRNIGIGAGGQESCVWLSNCRNCTVEHNSFEKAIVGIHVEDSTECTLSNNHISNTLGGILLDADYPSNNSIISENDIGNNEYVGIALGGSNCIVRDNRIYNHNYYGIYLIGDQNTFYHNILYNNTVNVLNMWVNKTLGGYNTWDNGFEGNYWDDYSGFDADGDRIGDTPYMIDGKNNDYYPLIGSPAEDHRPPTIISNTITNALPSFNPQLVNPLDVVQIQVNVFDQQSGIKQVMVYYGADYLNNSVSMVQISGNLFNATYEAWICPWIFLNSCNQASITYQVQATDFAENVVWFENITFYTAELSNSLNIDLIISQVNTEEKLSVILEMTLSGHLPAWRRSKLYVEVSNWRADTEVNSDLLVFTPLWHEQRSSLDYQEAIPWEVDLIGGSEAYPFDSYYLNLTFRFNPSLPDYLTDAYWGIIYADAFKVFEEKFNMWANVTLSVNAPHYIHPALESTWGDPQAQVTYVNGLYNGIVGFDSHFILGRQLNDVLPLLLLIISMTYMLGATMLADARWNPEVKTAIYLSFFVMAAGFNFALGYLIPFRYGLTVAEALFISLTVSTTVFSIGFIISNILHTKVSKKAAKSANSITDLSAICFSIILLTLLSVPALLLVIESIGLFYGFVMRMGFLDRLTLSRH